MKYIYFNTHITDFCQGNEVIKSKWKSIKNKILCFKKHYWFSDFTLARLLILVDTEYERQNVCLQTAL